MRGRVVETNFNKNPPRISYYSEMTQDYIKAIHAAKTLEELRLIIERYKPFAFDAWRQVQTLTWAEWKRGVRLSKKESVSAAEEALALIGDVIFPELLFTVSILAIEYTVPFGVAFNRLADVGRIEWKKDHFIVKNFPSTPK